MIYKLNNLVHEALESTDKYLKILSESRESKYASEETCNSFIEQVRSSYIALERLNVINEHLLCINKAINEMMIYGDENSFDLSFLKENNEPITVSDNDIDEMVENTNWEDIYDLYEENELVYKPEDLEEAISASSRLRKSLGMKRKTPRISLARNLKLKRTSSMEVLKKRSVLAARRALYKRFLMGREKSKLSAGEKDRLEKRIKNLKHIQATIALRMLPRIKSIEQHRLARKGK